MEGLGAFCISVNLLRFLWDERAPGIDFLRQAVLSENEREESSFCKETEGKGESPSLSRRWKNSPVLAALLVPKGFAGVFPKTPSFERSHPYFIFQLLILRNIFLQNLSPLEKENMTGHPIDLTEGMRGEENGRSFLIQFLE